VTKLQRCQYDKQMEQMENNGIFGGIRGGGNRIP